jgi:hypothetical protein
MCLQFSNQRDCLALSAMYPTPVFADFLAAVDAIEGSPVGQVDPSCWSSKPSFSRKASLICAAFKFLGFISPLVSHSPH